MFQNFRHSYLQSMSLIRRSAGHSKWQNIRHIKGAKDAERNVLYTKLSRQMKVAVVEGGSLDPTKNPKLSQILEQARRFNMPTATIQSILRNCQNDKSNAKTYLLEIKGPGNCVILLEVFTSNLHHLKQNIATVLKKHQSKFADSGVIYLFEEKGIIETEVNTKSKSDEETLEEATEHAIESNAEEVNLVSSDILQFVCSPKNFMETQKSLEKFGYNILNSNLEYTPIKMQDISRTDFEIAEKMFLKLEEFTETVRIFDNINVAS